MRLSSGIEILLKRETSIWGTSARSELYFKYVAPPGSDELSGRYTWKYLKPSKEYLLYKNGSSRVLARLADLCTDSSGQIAGKLQIYACFNISSFALFIKSNNNKAWVASNELIDLIMLSVLETLRCEERTRENRTIEKADEVAQTKLVMECGCHCHCFLGRCTLAKRGDIFADARYFQCHKEGSGD